MEESDVLRIQVATSDFEFAESDPLVADRGILTCWSSCVRGLTLDATEWDLSNLVIEGQAVERSTIVAWLNIIYQAVKAEVFESQEPNAAHTLRGMGQLLAFADAVGSSRGLMVALESHWVSVADDQVLTAEVRLGEHAITLRLADCCLSTLTESLNSTLELYRPGLHLGSLPYVGSSSDSIAECRRRFASDVEVLLFHAIKQQLPRLAEFARNFIKQSSWSNNRDTLLNNEAVTAVFSGRVLEAVLRHNDLLRRDMIDSILESLERK